MVKPPSPPKEYHIASFIAHARAEQLTEAKKTIKTITGAEIHAVNDKGKIVFTIAATSQKKIASLIDCINASTEILSVFPVYHQYISE